MCFAYQIFHRLGICSLYKALHCCSAVGMPGTCRHTWARLRYSSPISGLLCLLHSESRGPIQGKIVRNEKRLASLGSVYKLDGLKFLRQTVADGVRVSPGTQRRFRLWPPVLLADLSPVLQRRDRCWESSCPVCLCNPVFQTTLGIQVIFLCPFVPWGAGSSGSC